jgi:F0F1-type ATP synthase delta subunit
MKSETESKIELKIELTIQKGIRDAEDEIVIAIEDALDKKEYGKYDPKNPKDSKTLEESQFRNLLNVATSTNSSEVVKNFLRYQVGRDEKWGRGTKSLAEAIVTDIQKLLKDKAGEIATKAKVLEDVTAKTNEIHMELIRRYLGYGSRHLVYKRKGENIA